MNTDPSPNLEPPDEPRRREPEREDVDRAIRGMVRGMLTRDTFYARARCPELREARELLRQAIIDAVDIQTKPPPRGVGVIDLDEVRPEVEAALRNMDVDDWPK